MRGASSNRPLGFLAAALALTLVWSFFGRVREGDRGPPPLTLDALREQLGPRTALLVEREPFLIGAFQDGATVRAYDEDVEIEVRQIGHLQVRSGQITACDPKLLFPEPRAFADPVPNGDFPVEVSIAHRPNGGTQVAMARVRLTDREPVAFQLAPLDGGTSLQDLIAAGEGTGHAVEDGLSAFFDAEAALALWRGRATDAHAAFRESLDEALVSGSDGIELSVSGAAGNTAVFPLGSGDRFGLAFWGYDAFGERAVLVTDGSVLGDGG